MKKFNLQKLGPGLLFAGAAIGVSHLVQSTRAGADFGWGLLWALLLSNLFKYPFFQFGTRFALATHKNLLEGYFQLGKHYLWLYFFLNIATMFTIQTAVTIVTAGLASSIFGITPDLVVWSAIITAICLSLLLFGKYAFLDKAIKAIIVLLTLCTIISVVWAGQKNTTPLLLSQVIPQGKALLFLIAFMGWMPAPLDISIWQSLWALEKKKTENLSYKEALFDFNVGYVVTVILGICFVGLGAFVMYGSGTTFSSSGGVFANQLVALYTKTLGDELYIFIAVAAFTTMFSTTLTTLDASPRAMEKTIALLAPKVQLLNYRFWIIILASGTLFIFAFLASEMGRLVAVATTLSFVTAPLYAFLNFRLVTGDQMPEEARPKKGLLALSILGLLFLSSFAIGFLFTL